MAQPADDDVVEFAPSYSQEGDYSTAAVVTNTQLPSIVGRDILAKGGSAVDAAVAALLCEGLTGMQNMGLGGGHFLTIYKRNVRRAYFMDAREAAPLQATRHMFRGNSSLSSTGGKAVAVPGELMGYWEAHRRFGVLPWKALFEPAITMCSRGIPVNSRLAKSFAHSGMEREILESDTLRQVLAPGGRLPHAGEFVKMPALARTLLAVAEDNDGAGAFYNGSLTDAFLRDVNSSGSIISREDLAQYRVNWYEPISARLNDGLTLYTAPPPASGPLLAFMIQSLEGQLHHGPRPNVLNYSKIAEALKYAYALRTELGDPAFIDNSRVTVKCSRGDYLEGVSTRLGQMKRTVNDPKYYGAQYHRGNRGGTINIVVHAPNGDSVVATSTINTLFGSLLASPSTGIILNNEMDDFSSPRIVNCFGIVPSQANFIEGGKRPLSSAAPSIVVGSNGDVRMAVGSAGGTHITSAVAQVLINHLWYGMSIKQSVDWPRLHHQLLPMILKYESGFPVSIVHKLSAMGHQMKEIRPHSSVTALAVVDGRVKAIYDHRRGGNTSGF